MNPPRPDPRSDSPDDTPVPEVVRQAEQALPSHIRRMIRQEVANGMMDFSARLAAVESDVAVLKGYHAISASGPPGMPADITGTYTLADIRHERRRWEDRERRKADIERRDLGRIRLVWWKTAAAMAFIAFQAFLGYLGLRHK